jgi:V8-like Glu-specific endopeptidase
MGRRLPSFAGIVRPLVIALGCAAVLGACAARPPEPPSPRPTAGWQAAIGSLEVAGSGQICTAVLVRPDLIATVSHCLHPRGVMVAPSHIIFTSSASSAVQARGVSVMNQGGEVRPGTIEQNQAGVDWALVRITPAITSVRPIAVAPISAAMARAEIAKGARFYSAGYGRGAKNRLSPHERCGLLPPDPEGLVEGDYFFATNCIIRLGDSGGPVAIVNGERPELIGLIVGFTEQPGTGEPIGIIVSARAFASYVGSALVSQGPPHALPQPFPMN